MSESLRNKSLQSGQRLISKKAYADYFRLVQSGQKTFDLRVADFDVEPGDVLELVEIDETKKPTGKSLRRKVGVVAHTKRMEAWYDSEGVSKNGYLVMSLQDEKSEKNRQIVDENDVVLGAKLDHMVDFASDIYRVSVLWLCNSKGEVLVARRSRKNKNGGGLWGPSAAGTVESTETYLENIAKETEEEIGLTGVQFITGPKRHFDAARKYFVQHFFASIDKAVDEFELEDEVESVKWVAKDWLMKDVKAHSEKYLPHTEETLEKIVFPALEEEKLL